PATAHLDGGLRRVDTGKVESGDQVVAVLTDVGSRRETGTSVRSHGPEVTEEAVDVGEGAGDQSVGHGNLLVVFIQVIAVTRYNLSLLDSIPAQVRAKQNADGS